MMNLDRRAPQRHSAGQDARLYGRQDACRYGAWQLWRPSASH
jgi:hypothetical protein